jgi:hypothetical protein
VTAQYNSTSANLDEDEFIQQKKKEGRYQAIRADVTKESDVAELFKVAEEGSGGKVVSSLIGESSPAPILRSRKLISIDHLYQSTTRFTTPPRPRST